MRRFIIPMWSLLLIPLSGCIDMGTPGPASTDPGDQNRVSFAIGQDGFYSGNLGTLEQLPTRINRYDSNGTLQSYTTQERNSQSLTVTDYNAANIQIGSSVITYDANNKCISQKSLQQAFTFLNENKVNVVNEILIQYNADERPSFIETKQSASPGGTVYSHKQKYITYENNDGSQYRIQEFLLGPYAATTDFSFNRTMNAARLSINTNNANAGSPGEVLYHFAMANKLHVVALQKFLGGFLPPGFTATRQNSMRDGVAHSEITVRDPEGKIYATESVDAIFVEYWHGSTSTGLIARIVNLDAKRFNSGGVAERQFVEERRLNNNYLELSHLTEDRNLVNNQVIQSKEEFTYGASGVSPASTTTAGGKLSYEY